MAVASTLCVTSLLAPAQPFPSKPVRIIVGFPPGGGTDIVARLHSDSIKVLQTPEVKEKLVAQGTDPVGSTPEEFGAFMKAETAKWARVIREANIRAD